MVVYGVIQRLPLRFYRNVNAVDSVVLDCVFVEEDGDKGGSGN
jgi:hypothetical protein